jgi:VWFA-related protein
MPLIGRWLALALASSLLPQSSAPRATPGSTDGDAPPVHVTAIVTDPRGANVGGLTAADFELTVDGQPQAIQSAEARQDASPRAVAFLLDEFHTADADAAAVRAALLQFVDRHVRTGDLAVVVKPLDPLTGIRLTADKEALRQAISTFDGRKGDYTPRSPFERNYMAQAPEAVASARGQIVSSALRAIGATLTDSRDMRKAIVLVSDGFARMRMNRDLPASLQSAVRIANRADAPVYAFAPALTAPADGTEADPGFLALRALASGTGGDLVTGAAAIEDGLGRMIRELERHYLLTYRAPHGNDGRFHALQLAVKRRGATVRARSGYVAAAPPRALTPEAVSAPLRVLRRSALIQSWSGVQPAAEGGRVTLTWEPSAPRPAAPARARAATVVITAAAADGTVLFDSAVAALTDPASPDVPNLAEFDAPTGPVRVDMKILDDKGVVIDTDARDVVVPVRRKDGPTIYPPAVVRTRSAREFREAVAAATVAPIAAREFRRTDRLLIKVPVADAVGQPLPATAVLLNRMRQPMREVPAMPPSGGRPSPTMFDLPLSGLAPGEYTLRINATGSGGTASEYVSFRVTG